MQNTANGNGVRQESCNLAHTTIRVYSLELSRVHKSVPVCHVDSSVVKLQVRQIGLMEDTAGSEIVVILIDLTERVTHFKVLLVMVHPVLFAAVDRHTAVRALKSNMGRRHIACRLCRFLSFASHSRQLGRLVIGVWAVCMLLHKSCATTKFGNRRVGKGVEEVVLAEFDRRGRAIRVGLSRRRGTQLILCRRSKQPGAMSCAWAVLMLESSRSGYSSHGGRGSNGRELPQGQLSFRRDWAARAEALSRTMERWLHFLTEFHCSLE